jgi:hypothetical protein
VGLGIAGAVVNAVDEPGRGLVIATSAVGLIAAAW